MHRDVPIRTLIDGLPITMLYGDGRAVVRDLVEDSRQVTPGSLFVARAGLTSDGRRFIGDAIAAGAVAVLHDGSRHHNPEGNATGYGGVLESGRRDVVSLRCDDPSAIAPVLAERFFGNPSRQLDLIGITGTNGKTTTCWLVRDLLNFAGRRCGLMGTVEVDDGRVRRAAMLTTPPSFEISRTLARMVEHECRAAAMEVSSHALHQRRVAGLGFRIAAFTNLTGDHLDYHGTMDAYADAKAMLFSMLEPDAVAVVNADDLYAERMIRSCRARVIRIGVDGASHAAAGRPEFVATIRGMSASGTSIALDAPGGSFEFNLPLVGRHNLSNALTAVAIVHALGLPVDEIVEALQRASAPPGRMEPMTADHSSADFPAVFVDYAHTDDALANVLRAVRPIVPKGAALWVVFGCGGDRDRSKRPRMAAAACELADRIMITSDNPRTEDSRSIIEEIFAGVPEHRRADVRCEVDRRRAIHDAIALAAGGDVVVIAGKGHEDYQIIGEVKVPFDDRIIAREAMLGRSASFAAGRVGT